ncbi:hypothetical protein C8J56DRAFT_926493 [Mycena floridula]|nr:hypothetical protein C8J56DRAFT_926493 [Mycena floridula]
MTIDTREWFERWETDEPRQMRIYDPNSNQLSRLYMAVNDFKMKRRWPPEKTGVRFLYEQFLLYVGTIPTLPIWHRTDRPNYDPDDDDAVYDSDEEAANVGLNVGDSSGSKQPAKLRPRPPYDVYDQTPILVASDEEVKALLDAEHDRRETKMVEFIHEPAKHIQIFLSSYFHLQGFIWTDSNLLNAPRLLSFFVKFILRHHVFPEPGFDDGFRKALEVIDLAAKELPLTAQLTKALPDYFNLACNNCFSLVVASSNAEEPPKPVTTAEQAAFKASLEVDDVQIIEIDDIESEAPITRSEGRNWGQSTAHDASLEWTSVSDPFLMTLLGPTSFPLTHSRGVVEKSLRRIKAIIPRATLPSDRSHLVEAGLDSAFGKLVLSPWTLDEPKILSDEGEAHDPLVDDIIILADENVFKVLNLEMGLRGTFVQLARKAPTSGLDTYWYLEQLELVLTSYHEVA